MKTVIVIGLWLAAIMVMPEAQAQAPTVAARATRVSDDDRRIVDNILPRATYISGNMQTFTDAFQGSLTKNPTTAKMIADNPGLAATMTEAGQKAMRIIIEAEYLPLREKLAAGVAQGLQPEDYAPVLRFLATPAAVKMRAASYGPSSRALMVDRAIGNADHQFTAADNTAMKVNAAAQSLKTLTPEELGVVNAFSRSTPGRHYLLAQETVNAIALDWANGLAGKSQPVSEAVQRAAQQYFKNKK